MDNIRCLKFLFEAKVGKLSLAVKFACQIKLIWKRSNEVASIEPIDLVNGQIQFDRKLSLPVNMYFDVTKKQFLEKKSIFSLILVTPKGQKSAGAVSIDLAARLNQHQEEYHGIYPLEKCPVPNSTLQLTISSHMMAQAQLDSMSQMTSAQENIMETSAALENSIVGEISTISNFSRENPNSGKELILDSPSTTNTQDLLSFDMPAKTTTFDTNIPPSNLTDNILKINDTSDKINNFIHKLSDSLRKQLQRLREANRQLQQDLNDQKTNNDRLDNQLKRQRLAHENLKSQTELLRDQHTRQLSELKQSNKSLQDRLESSQQLRSNLQSASVSGDQEKMKYMEQLKQQNQQKQRQNTQELTRLKEQLKKQQQQTYVLKNSNNSLTNQLKMTQTNLQQAIQSKRQLQAERKDNQQEVQAARIRLEKVYAEMLGALQDIL